MKSVKSILLCFLLCILSAFLTLCVINVRLINKQSSAVNKKDSPEDLYSAALTLCRIYDRCNHTITDSSPGTISYSSSEELLKRYPGYEITSGEEEKIVLTASVDNFCPHHYKAVLSGKKITITRLSDGKTTTAFEIMQNSLSDNEKSLLEQGVILDSQKALTSFIEDFTS